MEGSDIRGVRQYTGKTHRQRQTQFITQSLATVAKASMGVNQYLHSETTSTWSVLANNAGTPLRMWQQAQSALMACKVQSAGPFAADDLDHIKAVMKLVQHQTSIILLQAAVSFNVVLITPIGAIAAMHTLLGCCHACTTKGSSCWHEESS